MDAGKGTFPSSVSDGRSFELKHLKTSSDNSSKGASQKSFSGNLNKKRIPKFLRILGYGLGALAIFMVCVALFMVSYIVGLEEWKLFDPAEVKNMKQSAILYDRSGKEFLRLSADEARTYVSIEDIPPHVKNAFIAIEDQRFYQHKGIDIKRIAGAVIADIREGSLSQGASTISQQVVKMSHLTPQKTVTRKLTEIMMSIKLERYYSKEEILELYLNLAYFGNGAYGIEEASLRYFSKHAADLSLAEGASLAAVLKSPTNYAPHLHPESNRTRRDLVLQQMLSADMIDGKEYRQALKEDVQGKTFDSTQYPFGYYTDLVLQTAADELHLTQQELLSGGYRIYTNLDPLLQNTLENTVQNKENFPSPAADGTYPECAGVVINTKGELTALVGGSKHTTRLSFNRATEMRRQPGSTIKPVLVYAPAIEYLGYTPTTFILDQQEDFDGYTPRNAGNRYRGWITMRNAVALSINVPAVRLLQELTVPRAKAYASSVGIPFEKEDTNLALALGGFTTGVTPLELAASYLPFANEGVYRKPNCIRYITDAEGEKVFENDQPSYTVLSEETAFLINSMLTSSVEYGTSKALSGMQLAAKTGTSGAENEEFNKDAWMVAYNREYIACIWMGFDINDEIHHLEKGVTGGTYPAQMMKDIFQALYPSSEYPEFERPSTVKQVRIDKVALEERLQIRAVAPWTDPDHSLTEEFPIDAAPIFRQDIVYFPNRKQAENSTIIGGRP